jgi:hypothetical protein
MERCYAVEELSISPAGELPSEHRFQLPDRLLAPMGTIRLGASSIVAARGPMEFCSTTDVVWASGSVQKL